MDRLSLIPHDVVFMIGRFCSVSDATLFQRVSRIWKEALVKAAKKRKSLSLTPFPNQVFPNQCSFHCIDSFVAALLHITREDLVGCRFYNLYRRQDNFLLEDQANIVKLFKTHPNVEYIEVVFLTEVILQMINEKYPKLKGLAFHNFRNDERPDVSKYSNLTSSLEILVYGKAADNDFVKKSCGHFLNLKIIAFMSQPYTEQVTDSGIRLDSLSQIGDSVSKIYFGTRLVALGDSRVENAFLKSIIENSNMRKQTHLEILHPTDSHLNKFIKDVLPSFQKLQNLKLNLRSTFEAINAPNSIETISLIALHDLKSLTLIVDASIPYGRILGKRPLLETLRICGAPADPDPESCNHSASFGLDDIRDIVENAPNLKYLCVNPLEKQSGLSHDYTTIIKHLKELRVLHLPTCHHLDDEIIADLKDLPHLKRLEFVGTAPGDVMRRAQELRCGLRFAIVFQNDLPYCPCSYRVMSHKPFGEASSDS